MFILETIYKDTLYIHFSNKKHIHDNKLFIRVKKKTQKNNLPVFIADIIVDIITNTQCNNVNVKYTLFIVARVCLQVN